jgi:hypothetical protein
MTHQANQNSEIGIRALFCSLDASNYTNADILTKQTGLISISTRGFRDLPRQVAQSIMAFVMTGRGAQAKDRALPHQEYL